MQHSNKAPMATVAIAAKIFCTQGLGFIPLPFIYTKLQNK